MVPLPPPGVDPLPGEQAPPARPQNRGLMQQQPTMYAPIGRRGTPMDWCKLCESNR